MIPCLAQAINGCIQLLIHSNHIAYTIEFTKAHLENWKRNAVVSLDHYHRKSVSIIWILFSYLISSTFSATSMHIDKEKRFQPEYRYAACENNHLVGCDKGTDQKTTKINARLQSACQSTSETNGKGIKLRLPLMSNRLHIEYPQIPSTTTDEIWLSRSL